MSDEIDDDIDDVMDSFFEAREAIFEHVGYVESWRILPIDDSRDQFWAVDAQEDKWVKFSPSRDGLFYWLGDHDDEYGTYGDMLYQNQIYTQRHLPRWVYRGAELTMVVVDTRTDGNQCLQVFRNDHEVRLGAAPQPSVAAPSLPAEHPLNQAIDAMIEIGRAAYADSMRAKVIAMCEEVDPSDLRIAIEVHRANCQQPGCLVLAVMEEIAGRGAS